MEPIRRLTLQDTDFNWTEEQENAFREVKRLVTTATVLSYYDPKAELEIQCDASQTVLGAALLQRGRPIAYTSRALTETERRYAQIEKEMLAIVFSLEKFHQYTYGRHVKIQSDHKPLEFHLTEASRVCAKTTTRYDVEASKIRLRSAVRTRRKPTLSGHPFQSIPADHRPSHWS